MNWLIPTIIATIASGLLAVSVKMTEYYYTHLSTSTTVLLFTAIGVIILYIIQGHKFKFSYYSLFAGLIFGVVLYLLFEAISLVNNPGLAMALFRTQCVLTFIICVIMFKYKINFIKILSMAVLICGAFMIVLLGKKKKIDKKEEIDKKKEIDKHKNSTKKDNKKWIVYIIIALILYSIYDILTKLAIKKSCIEINNHTLIVVIFAFIISFIIKAINNKKITFLDKKNNIDDNHHKYRKHHILALSFTCVFMIIFLIGINMGIANAPNPSYAKAVLVFSMVITTIISKFTIKGSSIAPKQWGGIVLIILGTLGITLH